VTAQLAKHAIKENVKRNVNQHLSVKREITAGHLAGQEGRLVLNVQ